LCPICAVPLVSERGAAPWCERCAWGIDVYEPPRTATWWQRRTGAIAHQFAYRLSMKQFRELASGTMPYGPGTGPGTGRGTGRGTGSGTGSGTSTGAVMEPVVGSVARPRVWSRARFAVMGFALFFYALIAALAAVGGWLVLFRFPNLSLVPGLLLLLIAVYLVPRVERVPRHAEVLTREQAPSLYGLIDRMARTTGTPAPTLIIVDPWFNAATGVVGLRRTRILTLGLGLWGALSPPQRVALLGHELAHFSNGDARRGFLVSPAMTTLSRLSELFLARNLSRISRRSLIGPLQPLVDLTMRLISSGLHLAHLGVLVIVLRDGQRAEYLADQRAVRLAGSQATIELLNLLLTSADSVIASRARAKGTQVEWRAAATESLTGEAAAMNRLRQLSTRTEASLWASHPPTGLRAWLVEGAAWQEPAFVLAEDESERIDAELARQYQSARRDLAQSSI
jgi:heat shock protein HtpX